MLNKCFSFTKNFNLSFAFKQNDNIVSKTDYITHKICKENMYIHTK